MACFLSVSFLQKCSLSLPCISSSSPIIITSSSSCSDSHISGTMATNSQPSSSILNNYSFLYFCVVGFSVSIPMPVIPPSLPLTVKINVTTVCPDSCAAAVCYKVVGLVNTTFPVKGFPIREQLGDIVLDIL